MIWLIIILAVLGLGCLAVLLYIILTEIMNGCRDKKEPITIYEVSESSKAIRQEREESARKFWKAIAFAEEIFGRKLTEKEVWRLMQQGKWHCVGCDEKLEKIDDKLVECPLCGLKFQKDNAKSKIKCINNSGEIIL